MDALGQKRKIGPVISKVKREARTYVLAGQIHDGRESGW